MSCLFEPRKVHKSDIKDWWIETLDLFRRQPGGFLLLSVCYYFTAFNVVQLSWIALIIGLLVCQIIISATIILARNVDETRKLSIKDYLQNIKNILVYLLVMTLVYSIFFAAVIVVSLHMTIQVPANDYSGTEVFGLLSWMLPGLLFFEVLYIYMMITSLWFFNPLLVLNGLSIRDCVQLSRKAYRKNEWIVFTVSFVPFMLFYLLLLTTEFILVFIFFAYPIFCIFQYVSYRHVFLGRKENSSVPIRHENAVLVKVKS